MHGTLLNAEFVRSPQGLPGTVASPSNECAIAIVVDTELIALLALRIDIVATIQIQSALIVIVAELTLLMHVGRTTWTATRNSVDFVMWNTNEQPGYPWDPHIASFAMKDITRKKVTQRSIARDARHPVHDFSPPGHRGQE